MSPDDVRRMASARLTMALWTAIEALECQAETLRTLAAEGHGKPGTVELADQAEGDARLLREIAGVHVVPSVGGRVGNGQ